MNRIFLSTIAALAVLASAPSARAASFLMDRTESLLTTARMTEGLREEGGLRAGSVEIHIYTTQGARDLAARGELDVADPAFDLGTLLSRIRDAFADSVGEFEKLWGNQTPQPIREIHLIVSDLGEARKSTISETRQNSRVIYCDLRRWHKIQKTGRLPYAELSSIHEFTHAVNYATDPNETKLHRELIAVVVEVQHLAARHGRAFIEGPYLSTIAGPLASRDQPLSTAFQSNTPLRHLAATLYLNVTGGKYGSASTSLDSFAMKYLRSEEVGDAGFDAAARAVHLSDASGKALTIEQLRRDAYEASP